MAEIKLNLRPNLLRLFRYLSAIILNCFSIPITFSFTTLSPVNLRLFFLSFLVKGFFLLVFFGNSELLLINIEIDVKDSVLDLI
ncbi:Uncharacterised protein [Orientia tsutsugamushi]|uniref:Uncharacterized protein n=1 Tax=Orientia tsutsugamushi TaxID=784 RepID=A0A2U3QR27_ORITS|nr:Uncharacterised protein [Orientia tsutsugamushi]